MSIRTTITLDEDVLERVKQQSRLEGASFRDTLNELLRLGLVHRQEQAARRKLNITAFSMGHRAGLNYDDVESLLEYGEGEQHR